MMHRSLSLLAAGLLLVLGGCASQQAAIDPAASADARLNNVEGIATLALDRNQASQARLGELDRKLDGLSRDLQRLAESVTGQDARQRELVERLARQGQEAGQQARAAAGSQAERMDGVERQLRELAAEARDQAARTAALQAGLPGLRDQAAQAAASVAAGRADDLAARLARLEKRLEEVAGMAQDALDATGLGQRRIVGKVVHSVTLTDDKTLFPINSPVMGDKDMAKLDELAARVKAMGTWFHLQIQGHTDGFGSEDYNYELGRARAEVVKNYLNEKGGIPLLRMSVISYGAAEAAQQTGKNNRRIVVHVLQ
jgi:outer membrane protein OmpA-like peptidoglycan-associated protein